jgi:hypothetical protein
MDQAEVFEGLLEATRIATEAMAQALLESKNDERKANEILLRRQVLEPRIDWAFTVYGLELLKRDQAEKH